MLCWPKFYLKYQPGMGVITKIYVKRIFSLWLSSNLPIDWITVNWQSIRIHVNNFALSGSVFNSDMYLNAHPGDWSRGWNATPGQIPILIEARCPLLQQSWQENHLKRVPYAQIWPLYIIICMDVIQHRAMRTFLGVGKCAPLPMMYGDMYWIPSHARQQAAMFRYWVRLLKMPPNRYVRTLWTKSTVYDTVAKVRDNLRYIDKWAVKIR